MTAAINVMQSARCLSDGNRYLLKQLTIKLASETIYSINRKVISSEEVI